MGVAGLWPLLSGLGTLKPLSQCTGFTLAVDLSTWICQGKAAGPVAKHSPRFFMIRTIFYRTIELLKYGVKLVFVLDGEVPGLKQVCLHKRQTVRGLGGGGGKARTSRSNYKETTKVVVELLESLGLPVIHSPGEAEKMCAYLNSTKVVDAVLTEDGDAFLYGAPVIMRKFDKSDTSAVRVTMSDIEDRRCLSRRSLIAFALLSGCDYNEGGVKGVGPEQIGKLFDEMRQNCVEEEDILSRICGWKDNQRLQDLAELKKSLDCAKKATHCSQCHHTGTMTGHQSKGCKACRTECECQADSGAPCNCTWHKQQREITPHVEELKVRGKALEDKTFTDVCKKVVIEFTEVRQESCLMMTTSVNWQRPRLERLFRLLNDFLHMDRAKVMTTMIPVLAYMQLREEFDWSGFKPISIQKACQRHFVDCYQTIWSKLDEDRWTTGEFYTVDIEESLFQTRCPEFVSCFQEEIEKKNVPATPVRQPNIRDMLLTPEPLRKKSKDKRQNEKTPVKVSLSQKEENVNKCKKKIDFDATGTASHATGMTSHATGMSSHTSGMTSHATGMISHYSQKQEENSSSQQLGCGTSVDDTEIDVDDDSQQNQKSSQGTEVVSSSCQSSKDHWRDEDEWHSLKSEDLFSYGDVDDDGVVGNDGDGGGVNVKKGEVVVIVSDSEDSDSCNTRSNVVRQHLPVGLEDSESNLRSTDSDDVMVVRSSDSTSDLALPFNSDSDADTPKDASEDTPEDAPEDAEGVPVPEGDPRSCLHLPAEETGSTFEDDAIPVADESSSTSIIVLHSDSDVEDVTISRTGSGAKKRTISGIMQKPAKKRRYTKRKVKESVKQCDYKSNQTRIYNYFSFKKKY